MDRIAEKRFVRVDAEAELLRLRLDVERRTVGLVGIHRKIEARQHLGSTAQRVGAVHVGDRYVERRIGVGRFSQAR
jgi:hypothetical protein